MPRQIVQIVTKTGHSFQKGYNLLDPSTKKVDVDWRVDWIAAAFAGEDIVGYRIYCAAQDPAAANNLGVIVDVPVEEVCLVYFVDEWPSIQEEISASVTNSTEVDDGQAQEEAPDTQAVQTADVSQ